MTQPFCHRLEGVLEVQKGPSLRLRPARDWKVLRSAISFASAFGYGNTV